MMKLLKLYLIAILLSTNTFAASDGELELSKKPNPTKDCFEPVNRFTFAVNNGLDKVIFKPVASVYRNMPSPVRAGAGNALNNLSNLITIPNNVLQGEIKIAGINTGRLIVNTTVGIFGLIDVANHLGFPEYNKEDYGQTLGVWGIGPGCYLVLPVIGPSTIRDTAGSFLNVFGGDPWYNASASGNNEFLNDSDYIASRVLAGIDFRAKNLDALDNLEKNSLDFYASVRSLYLQNRKQKILNTNKITETLDDSDWEEIDN